MARFFKVLFDVVCNMLFCSFVYVFFCFFVGFLFHLLFLFFVTVFSASSFKFCSISCLLFFLPGAGGERGVQQLLITAVLGTTRDSFPEGTGLTGEGA